MGIKKDEYIYENCRKSFVENVLLIDWKYIYNVII